MIDGDVIHDGVIVVDMIDGDVIHDDAIDGDVIDFFLPFCCSRLSHFVCTRDASTRSLKFIVYASADEQKNEMETAAISQNVFIFILTMCLKKRPCLCVVIDLVCFYPFAIIHVELVALRFPPVAANHKFRTATKNFITMAIRLRSSHSDEFIARLK